MKQLGGQGPSGSTLLGPSELHMRCLLEELWTAYALLTGRAVYLSRVVIGSDST